MNKLNVKEIVINARQRLGNKDYRRLVMIHTGVTVAFALVSILLQFVLAEGIGNTGGLSGMGMRSVLETAQLVLQWANTLLLPFWSLGFFYVALLWAREAQADKRDLLAGFHRVGPYLGLMLNRAILTILVLVVSINISSVIYMMTPAADRILELAESFGNTDQMYDYLYSLDMEQIMVLLRSMIPMMVIGCVLASVLLIPLLYRFRMAEYVILDQKGIRGIGAMILSAALLRRRRWQLFKLDLRFWWYYGLKLLCTVLLYGDMILETVGVVLPVGSGMAYVLTYVLYLGGLFAVEISFRPRVETAYACAYEQLKEMNPIEQKIVPVKPQDMPWDEE